MEYEIEKNIPIDKVKSAGKYPFADMQVKDSFIISETYSTEDSGRFRMAALQYGRTEDPVRKFKVRKTKNGKTRIWRIK